MDFVTVCVYEALKRGLFPDNLNVQMEKSDKWTDRPVSIFPLSSKVYERVIYEQASNYFEPFFNEILCGFRKVHSTPHALFKLLTSCQNS